MEYLALQCFENVQIFHIFLTFRAQIPIAKSGGQEAVSSILRKQRALIHDIKPSA